MHNKIFIQIISTLAGSCGLLLVPVGYPWLSLVILGSIWLSLVLFGYPWFSLVILG